MRKLPQFIAIDGEGRNVDGIGSEHLYTLLANSHDEYVENAEYGLDTSICLAALCSWKARFPDATFVGFATNYDINMMLRDVPKEMLQRLWKIGRTYWTDYERSLTYRIEYIPSKWFNIIPQTRVNGKLQSIKGAGCKIWDVWGFFQKKFTSVLEEWLNPTELDELGAFIATMKDARGEFTSEMQPLIRRYCIAECQMLVKVMDKLAKSLWDADLPIDSWLGAGAIATKMLQDNAVKHTLEWEHWPLEIKNAAMWAYFGGRVEIFQQGIIPGPIYDYDVQSAYPSAIASLPFLREGWWSTGDMPTGASHVHQLIAVEWDTRETPYSWLAPFPQHFEDGRVAWESIGKGIYHNNEWWAAKNLFGDAIKETAVYTFTPISEYATPFSFVKGYYARKAQLKRRGDPRYYPLKVGLNSLYGKLAQSMGRTEQWGPPPYQNYYLAGKVTAEIRARMLMALAHAGKASAVMVATDGLFTRKKISNLVPCYRLGGWERTELPKGMTLVQAGVWWEPGDAKARRRTRGFGARSVTHGEASFLFKEGAPPEIYYQEVRFIGLGYCVNTGDWTNWRRWIDVERTLSANLEPHKQTSFVEGTQWGYVAEYIRHDPDKRRPYSTRRERMAEPDAEQVDAIQATEQPEGAGQ